jgi:hypothetical protein
LVFQMISPDSVMVSADARSGCLSWPVFCVPAGTPVRAPDGKPRQFFVAPWAAPEVISASAARIEPAVDLFGFGVTFYWALVGPANYKEARRGTVWPDVRELVPDVTAPTATLLGRLLRAEPGDRLLTAEVLSHLERIDKRLGGGTSRAAMS